MNEAPERQAAAWQIAETCKADACIQHWTGCRRG
jgi:hypothetical protein